MDNLRKDAPQEIGGVKVVKVEDYGNSTCSDGTTIQLPKSNVLKILLRRWLMDCSKTIRYRT